MTTLADRTFLVRTFGCQMNVHDAERVRGLLSASGMKPAASTDEADVIVFLTCCVRENADERLYGNVAALKPLKKSRPDLKIAIGGCIGQRDGETLLERLPHVDVVFGTHNVARLPELLTLAERGGGPVAAIAESTDDFTTDLPSQREHPWHAWLPIMVGCDNFCSYCVVPYVRGPERSRPMEDIAAEARALAEDGVLEVTLLGQNVNSYGRDLYGMTRFAEVLEVVAGSGVERVRFATSHPKDLSEATIAAIRDIPQVCKALHLPVQSGSDAVLRRMNRRYTQKDYLGLVERLYAAMPDLALSTDIIVGFPGETEADFQATLDVVHAARYDQAFTFIYSPRQGTSAAEMDEQVPREVAQERFERLVEAVQRSAGEKNAALLGTVQRVLVEGPSKRDASQIAGRSEGNKVVHAPSPAGKTPEDLAGTFVDVEVTQAHRWYLSGTILI